MQALSERRAEILRALVEEHIRTSEPVSSRAVLDATGLDVSAATVRSELAALDSEGFAVQPHTSAGRVPTARAYRYYVDHLRPSKLTTTVQHRVENFFSDMHAELGSLLKATTELLTDLTRYPAVAIAPGPTGETIKGLHLVHVEPGTILTVLVTESGRVIQELMRLPEPCTPAELADAESTLMEAIVGSMIGSVAGVESAEVPPIVRAICGEVRAAIGRMVLTKADIYVAGTGQMTSVWDNLSTIRQVLEVLEAEANLLQIMARASGTSVRIGAEVLGSEDLDLAVVSSAFDPVTSGRVGVIGPIRMDYRRVISAVEGVAGELAERFGS